MSESNRIATDTITLGVFQFGTDRIATDRFATDTITLGVFQFATDRFATDRNYVSK